MADFPRFVFSPPEEEVSSQWGGKERKPEPPITGRSVGAAVQTLFFSAFFRERRILTFPVLPSSSPPLLFFGDRDRRREMQLGFEAVAPLSLRFERKERRSLSLL